MRRYSKVLLAAGLVALVPLLIATGAAGSDAGAPPPGAADQANPDATNNRAFAAGKYGIEIDGVMAGWLQSAEGGQATADVVVEKLGADNIQRKHLAGVKYEDITISCGTGMSKAFYALIQDVLNNKGHHFNGAIIEVDANQKVLSRMNFFNGLITEVTLPALDAASKDAAKMTIKFSPEITRRVAGSGKTVDMTIGKGEQKKWLPANFRLRIDGLEEATRRVNKIEALTVKQKVVEHAVGEMRDYQKEPANLEIPNLVFTTADSSAGALWAWLDDFVIKGNNGPDQEKAGTLEYLAPNLQDVLFTVHFSNLGIFKLTPEKVEAGSENIRRVKAEMYCEEMQFEASSAAWA